MSASRVSYRGGAPWDPTNPTPPAPHPSNKKIKREHKHEPVVGELVAFGGFALVVHYRYVRDCH